jgi:C-methyltransferase-like protein/putative zinc binding protein/methyltransferase family protein
MMKCRFCNQSRLFKFLNLGSTPLANGFLTRNDLITLNERKFPLEVYFCEKCGLVQIGLDVPPEELFNNYIYFSGTSDLVHRHAAYLAEKFKNKFKLNEKSFVLEIASNDGTVLKYFKNQGVKVIGVEPATNIANVCRDSGIDTINKFFNEETSEDIKINYGQPNIILGRHVLAHIPQIHGFVKGLKNLLDKSGVLVIEAPYLMDFIEKNEFDTIYHEHYSYLSVRSVEFLFKMFKMELFDVERVDIHGGSILFYIGNNNMHPVSPKVHELRKLEFDKGLDRKETYIKFSQNTEKIKKDLIIILNGIKGSGKRIAAYGAPAKGNTLLNYCGISRDLIEYTVDKSPYKQNLFTPGSHLPVYSPDKLRTDPPDYLLLLAWNFLDEILIQQKRYFQNGGKYIVPIPEVRIIA